MTKLQARLTGCAIVFVMSSILVALLFLLYNMINGQQVRNGSPIPLDVMSARISTEFVPGHGAQSNKKVLNVITKQGTYRVIINKNIKLDVTSGLYLVKTGAVENSSFHREWLCPAHDSKLTSCMKTMR